MAGTTINGFPVHLTAVCLSGLLLEVRSYAAEISATVEFGYNDVTVTIGPDTDLAQAARTILSSPGRGTRQLT